MTMTKKDPEREERRRQQREVADSLKESGALDEILGLLHDLVTSELWCREALLKGCRPCPDPIPKSSART